MISSATTGPSAHAASVTAARLIALLPRPEKPRILSLSASTAESPRVFPPAVLYLIIGLVAFAFLVLGGN